MTYFGKSFYQGDFKNGLREGYGEMHYQGAAIKDDYDPDQAFEDRAFAIHKREHDPSAEQEAKDFFVYKGEWKRDRRHG